MDRGGRSIMVLSLYKHQSLASMMLDEVDSIALFYQ